MCSAGALNPNLYAVADLRLFLTVHGDVSASDTDDSDCLEIESEQQYVIVQLIKFPTACFLHCRKNRRTVRSSVLVQLSCMLAFMLMHFPPISANPHALF